ncbi:MAG: 1,4-alpha-glucan-branching enzyme, partial [Bacteroidaceae bacterium]
MNKMLDLIQRDPWLEPFEKAIVGRYQHTMDKEHALTQEGKIKLTDFSSGYLYFGLHRTETGWVFREWAPNATSIYLVGDFS